MIQPLLTSLAPSARHPRPFSVINSVLHSYRAALSPWQGEGQGRGRARDKCACYQVFRSGEHRPTPFPALARRTSPYQGEEKGTSASDTSFHSSFCYSRSFPRHPCLLRHQLICFPVETAHMPRGLLSLPLAGGGPGRGSSKGQISVPSSLSGLENIARPLTTLSVPGP